MAKANNLQVKKVMHPKNGKHKGMDKVTPLPSNGSKRFPRQNVGKKVGD